MMRLNPKTIKKLLQKENPIILEIGAHKGEDTNKFIKEFIGIKIYCFEPDPRCIEGFKKNIRDSRCTLVEAAVSNKDGKAMLNQSSGFSPYTGHSLIRFLGLGRYYSRIKKIEWDYSSSIKESVSNPKDFPWLIYNKKIEVKSIKLDTWIKENNIDLIDFIWSDVQGAEKDMIEGAVNTLKITRYLFIEYGEISTYPEAMKRDETIELLQKHNFEMIPKCSSREKIGNLLFKKK